MCAVCVCASSILPLIHIMRLYYHHSNQNPLTHPPHSSVCLFVYSYAYATITYNENSLISCSSNDPHLIVLSFAVRSKIKL